MFKLTKNKHGVLVCKKDPVPPGRSRVEDAEAIDLYQMMSLHHPEVHPLFFHVASERSASLRQRSVLKQAGLIKGVADYLLLVQRGGHPYAALELKRERPSDSSVQKEQTEFLKAAQDEGAFACVAYGADAAYHMLEKYLREKK